MHPSKMIVNFDGNNLAAVSAYVVFQNSKVQVSLNVLKSAMSGPEVALISHNFILQIVAGKRKKYPDATALDKI